MAEGGGGKAIALVKAHPNDPAALDGILLLTGEMRSILDEELTALALRNKHDARMGALCFNLMYRGGEPWAEAIVKAVAESNPSRDIPRPRRCSLRATSPTTRPFRMAVRSPSRKSATP